VEYRNNSHNPEKLLGSSPAEGGLCRSAIKQYRRMAQRTKLFIEEIAGTDIINPKTVVGSSPLKMLGLWIIFFSVIQRYMLKVQVIR
jgi:hypothetical protein